MWSQCMKLKRRKKRLIDGGSKRRERERESEKKETVETEKVERMHS